MQITKLFHYKLHHTDEPAEGMLSIKPDWDKYTIGNTSSSGIESELGYIKDDVTLKEAIMTYQHMREKLLKEAEDMSMNYC